MELGVGEDPAHGGKLEAQGLAVFGQLGREDLGAQGLVVGGFREAVQEDDGVGVVAERLHDVGLGQVLSEGHGVGSIVMDDDDCCCSDFVAVNVLREF
ncbi:hypothetical protein PG991_007062 [Apiospora marii]|uniref:Uncharacterized protein n=1 Tax=Apiospora marii TaxID=335849 RepID=A0ABR1S0N2_9PEZI